MVIQQANLGRGKLATTEINWTTTRTTPYKNCAKQRQDLLKWYGWGYKDSMFVFNDTTTTFTGKRYLLGGKNLPYAKQWIKEHFDVDISKPHKVPSLPTAFPKSRLPDSVKQELEKITLLSTDGMDRLIRAHGQTLHDVYLLRGNSFPRIPDAIVWPENHEQVEEIVKSASGHHFVIIPYGGGTSVSGAVTCPANESRPIVVLDTSDMNSILWLDKEQLLARVQTTIGVTGPGGSEGVCQAVISQPWFDPTSGETAESEEYPVEGIVGQDLERVMRSRGFTVGHEPDSYEFSTLGGWVATRASGMKKNTYGNIEDLVVQTKVVTPRGVIEKSCRVPRMSCGPEWEHIVLGSEGCLGVVTEVTLKIRPLPPVVRYGSLVFPDWDSGFYFEREVARQRLQPSSIRLMDNEQFRFGHALKMEQSWGGILLDGLKRFYITKIKGFDPLKLCVVTLLMEGTAEAVADSEKKMNNIAAVYGGVPGGAKNGEIGYTLTFVIAYVRDLALECDIVAESFETSVSWERALTLCRNTKACVRDACAKRRITHYLISCRLTQTYFISYFTGSISHHHGVGKLRKKWYADTVSEPGRNLLLAAKKALDPDNIFALGNMAFDQYTPDNSVKSKL
ncbi:jg4035 [Pararge aegeria aegeria]|uniref:Alkylglycerone-phosphate synthase n=1 Tax=Pararge aegeria aegeria TaxID=348720 RepID=A0A8S4RB50_9NEOP|nr:jg4035 [Pararge aegeria aegeria]